MEVNDVETRIFVNRRILVGAYVMQSNMYINRGRETFEAHKIFLRQKHIVVYHV